MLSLCASLLFIDKLVSSSVNCWFQFQFCVSRTKMQSSLACGDVLNAGHGMHTIHKENKISTFMSSALRDIFNCLLSHWLNQLFLQPFIGNIASLQCSTIAE